MENFNAKTICEGACVSALTVILLIIGSYVPIFNIFAVFVCSLPLIYLMIKRGTKAVIVSSLAALIISSLIFGNIVTTCTTAVTVLLPGLTAGYMMKLNKDYYASLFATTASVLFGMLLCIVLLNFFMGNENGIISMLDNAINTTKDALSPIIEEYENTGISDMTAMIDSVLSQTKNAVLTYFPTIVIICSILLAYPVLASAIFFMKRLRVKNYKYISFDMIKVPKSMGVILCAAMLISMFSGDDESLIMLVIKNITSVLSFIIAIDGMSVVDFYLKKRVKSGYRRFWIYFAVFIIGYIFISVIYYLLLLLGLFDSTRDLRTKNRMGEHSEK